MVNMIQKPIGLRAVVAAIDARDPESDCSWRYSREELVQMASRVLKETPVIKESEHDMRRRRTAHDDRRR
jgi:hypothetical protein